MNTQTYIKILFAVFIASMVFVGGASAHAATLYFETPKESYGVGDTFLLPLKLDTEGEGVNTVSVDIVFSDKVISILEVRDANSPVTHWIERPRLSGNSISFAGIMPGGFSTVIEAGQETKTTATIITLLVKVRSQGQATFEFTDAELYLNDGEGTLAELTLIPVRIAVDATDRGSMPMPEDTTPPEAFKPQIMPSAAGEGGEYILAFSTTDKGSGIAFYEVKEGSSPWIRTESPYPLRDQTLRSSIRVRAVDNSGNIRVAIVRAPLAIPAWFFTGILVAIAAVLYMLYRKYTKKYPQS